jgi:hypothetical protein
MEDYPLVYRCAIVVKPLQPFLDWLIKNDPTDDQSLEELQDDSNIYLLPDYEDVDDIEKAIEKYIKSKHAQIFTHELSAWYLDPSMYPKITYDTFRQWFAVSVHTMIYDTVSGDIDKE